ncbi:thioredoxin family protein [Soonwooa sp.]|uniref:thioredoxin family protein n=1 Tax=Soonwooa sp. TaxID=1938592 RepID=UPI002609244A|nr:thioredoxin family protein [Soonwooa sp.]
MNQENMKTQNEENLVLMQFYAEWCQPCRMMMPVINRIQERNYFWLNIKQIDVDADSEIANKFGIRSIPTFVVLKNNIEIWRKTGVISETELLETLNSLA